MQCLEPGHLTAILQDDPIPGIAIAAQVQPSPVDAVTELQNPLPQPLFHFVRRSPLLKSGLQKPQYPPKFLEQALTLDLARGVVRARRRGLSGYPALTSRHSLAGRSPVA